MRPDAVRHTVFATRQDPVDGRGQLRIARAVERIECADSIIASSLRRSLRRSRGKRAARSNALSHLPSEALAIRSCPVRTSIMRCATSWCACPLATVFADRFGGSLRLPDPSPSSRGGQGQMRFQTAVSEHPGHFNRIAALAKRRGFEIEKDQHGAETTVKCEGCICEEPTLSGRLFHCPSNADGSGEPDPRGGGHAPRICRVRRVTMRH